MIYRIIKAYLEKKSENFLNYIYPKVKKPTDPKICDLRKQLIHEIKKNHFDNHPDFKDLFQAARNVQTLEDIEKVRQEFQERLKTWQEEINQINEEYQKTPKQKVPCDAETCNHAACRYERIRLEATKTKF